jgi:SWI/SNF-related matrix-associated actin-dependent regulator 1 of chromatin subfamily A
MKKIELHGDNLHIKFSFDNKTEYMQLFTIMKNYKYRRYIAKEKYWIVPKIHFNEIWGLLEKYNFGLDKSLLPLLSNFEDSKETKKVIKEKKYLKEKIPIEIKASLRPYQVEALQFLQWRKGKGIIGYDMGLGKSVIAARSLSLLKDRNALIICKSSMKYKFKAELEKWLLEEENIHIIEGEKPYNYINNSIFIINYEILWAHVERLFKRCNIQTVIIDEFHFFKNIESVRYTALFDLFKGTHIKNFIPMSGTPFINSPIELFPILRLVEPKLFPSRWKFAQKYCDLKPDKYKGWDYSGSSNEEELYNILDENIMIRRRKIDVAKDIPIKNRVFIPLEINNRKDYNRCDRKFKEWILENEGKEIKKVTRLHKDLKLNQLASIGMLDKITYWVDDYLSNNSKLVLFAVHKAVVNYFYQHYRKIAVKIDGSTKTKDRNNIVNEFQKNPAIKLFIGNIKAAGDGITLTAAKTLCFVECSWSPDDQAEDRICRIGASGDFVDIIYFIAQNTIMETKLKKKDKKSSRFSRIIDGEEIDQHDLMMEKYMKSKFKK